MLESTEAVTAYPVLARMQADGECVFTGPVSAAVTVEREYDHLKAEGRVQVPAQFTCGRCLAEYQTVIDSSFRIICRRESERVPVPDDETELSDEDLISVSYTGDEIDFTHEIEEQVAMEIPLKPLCADGCRGLCTECGADLNTEPCSCSREPVSLAFSALKNFKVAE